MSNQVLTRPRPETEFSDYQTRLKSVEDSLKQLQEHIPSVELAWRSVTLSQQRFCEQFSDSYPDEDDVREFSRDAEYQCERLSRALSGAFVNEEKYRDANTVVEEYLREIAAIDYKNVIALHAEVLRYSNKLDSLRIAKTVDDEKIARNQDKLQSAREKYNRIAQPTLLQMRNVWKKAPIAFIAVKIAYWGANLRAADLFDETVADIRAFVEANEQLLAKNILSDITPEDLGNLKKHATSYPTTSLVDDINKCHRVKSAPEKRRSKMSLWTGSPRH